MKHDIQVIIIIGLPGSGKTTLTNKYIDNYKIYDDYVSKFYNGKILRNIKEGKKICLNDPRLCNIITFERHINKILKFISKDKIKLILFKNDPIQCLENIKNREKEKKDIVKTINYMTNIYDINCYKNFNHEIKNVYSSISNHPS